MNNTDVNPDSKKKKPNLIRETTNYKNPPSNDVQFSQKKISLPSMRKCSLR